VLYAQYNVYVKLLRVSSLSPSFSLDFQQRDGSGTPDWNKTAAQLAQASDFPASNQLSGSD
jgi:hypothetical protein